MQSYNKVSLLVLLAALILWVAWPQDLMTGLALILAAIVHSVRLARWAGDRTWREPLALVLHVGYAFVPLGALTIGAEILWAGTFGTAAAQHFWIVGAVGLMTLAVISRAALWHTGQRLTAGVGTVAIYVALIIAVLARIAAGLLPSGTEGLHVIAGLCQILQFCGFCIVYGPLLVRLPANKRPGGQSQ